MRDAMALASLFASMLALAACFGPSDQRPGLWIGGEVAEALPDDWTFSDEYREIAVEVRTPYLLPHSVTIWCAAVGGQLYVGARNPDTKSWPGWVDRDPNVRLGFDETVFEVRLVPVENEGRLSRVRQAYAAKYDLPSPGPNPPQIRYWVVEPRSE